MFNFKKVFEKFQKIAKFVNTFIEYLFKQYLKILFGELFEEYNNIKD